MEIPFIFDIVSDKNKLLALFINGEERFEAGKVTQTPDSVFIAIDQFDNELAFKIDGDQLTGVLRKQDKSGNGIALKAERGKTYRFASANIPPDDDISGTYDITFHSAHGREEKVVGLFTLKDKNYPPLSCG